MEKSMIKRVRGVAILAMLASVASACRSPDAATGTGEGGGAAAALQPAHMGHPIEFYTSRIAVVIDGVVADSQTLAALKDSDIASFQSLPRIPAERKYGDKVRGKDVLEITLTPEARKRRAGGW